MTDQPCFFFAGGGTGGHVYPLVAVADVLRRLRPDARCVFIGTAKGIETRVVPDRGYDLELMRVVPILGGGVSGALRGIWGAATALPHGFGLVRRHRPRAVFSLGGYAAGPVTLAARLTGVPVALLEPNAVLGLSNRLVAPLVRRAYTAFPEPEATFGERRVLRAGVPIRDGFEPREYATPKGPLRLLVLGGSQGAKALNDAVPAAVAQLPEVTVVHQCGRDRDTALRARYADLGAGDRAEVTPFIDDMPSAIAAADLVISRAGASAVMEIQAVGRPSILVPYPYAAGQHQLLNARSLEKAGSAVCLENAAATPERLGKEIAALAEAPGRLVAMAEAARRRGRPRAAETVARDLLELGRLDADATHLTTQEAS